MIHAFFKNYSTKTITWSFHVMSLDVAHIREFGALQVTKDNSPAVVAARAQDSERHQTSQQERLGRNKTNNCKSRGEEWMIESSKC